MKEQKTKNAATSAKVNGVKLETKAAKLPKLYRPKEGQGATTFFWDRTSNSVQSIAMLGVLA